MRVVALNGSPKKSRGNTFLILDPFLQGVTEGGAAVELHHLSSMKIDPCSGCLSCLFRKPGQCTQSDDWRLLLSSIGQADIIVLSTPIYFGGMSGLLKNCLDRTLPSSEPYLQVEGGKCIHPRRAGYKDSGYVLVSSCSFWELETFDPLMSQMQRSFKFAGGLLRPHAEALQYMLTVGERAPVQDILEAAKQAGRELAEEGAMSPSTLSRVSREIVPRETYVAMTNTYCKKVLGQAP